MASCPASGYWFQPEVISVDALLLIATYFLNMAASCPHLFVFAPVCAIAPKSNVLCLTHFLSSVPSEFHWEWQRGNESWAIWKTPYVIVCASVSRLLRRQDSVTTGTISTVAYPRLCKLCHNQAYQSDVRNSQTKCLFYRKLQINNLQCLPLMFKPRIEPAVCSTVNIICRNKTFN